MKYQIKLQKLYNEQIIINLMKRFKYSSYMQVPKLNKIIIHKGIGSIIYDKNIINQSIMELTSISGQKAILCLSKHDEAGFKLRKGMPIGIKVTLRRSKMYEFLERLIKVALPRVRDFNGVKNSSFDGMGNYNLGIEDQIIYPEVNLYEIKKSIGMNITFVTSAKNDIEAKELLSHFGIPFKKNNK
ncbi:50S ribosomal protein L5 [Blattabacterium cuenoti]|uniref:50S ribosomal protein L5 n=1 Tax=Blattabacterium cuenoti TaxID=1653831 RepID=UPI00163D227F|nr:50S ribosomal protein L5 [Blattabacterium cuenoti]